MTKPSDLSTKVIYHDNSLSSFITGIAFGAVAALMLGTEEGRELTQKLKKNLSHLAKNLEPQLQNLPQKAQTFVETVRDVQNLTPLPPELRPPQNNPVAGRLHRSGTTFTQSGRPL